MSAEAIIAIIAFGLFIGGLLFYLARETIRDDESNHDDDANYGV